MEKREVALRQALAENENEVLRWELYKKDHEDAITNLNSFVKHLTVDVMVPVGRKAYFPGKLIHTNEVMVGHYQGYFSMCSAEKAKDICEHRIEGARKHLELLKTEAELWQNKLEKPYLEGVIPTAGQYEIIEEYDEEKEKVWREEHKVRMRKAKLLEREDLKRQLKSSEKESPKLDSDIFKMLDEVEMMEELHDEMNNVDTNGDSDQLLEKLLSGEMLLPPPKPRLSHIGTNTEPVSTVTSSEGIKEQKFGKEAESASGASASIEMVERKNNESLTSDEDYDESVESDCSELPEELKIIEDQAKFLSVYDRVGFYQYQMQIIEERLSRLPMAVADDIETKLKMYKIRDHMAEMLEAAEEVALSDEQQDTECDDEEKRKLGCKSEMKRRISFALDDDVVEFRKNETVADMLPKSETMRDVVSLDEVFTALAPKTTNSDERPPSPIDRKQLILNKVEEHLKYIKENQEQNNETNIVDKIIGNKNVGRTLQINFKHSSQSGPANAAVEEDLLPVKANNGERIFVPKTPADFYRMVYFTTKGKEKEPAEKDLCLTGATLKESANDNAYEDPRKEFSNPRRAANYGKQTLASATTKPILRKKDAKFVSLNENGPDERCHKIEKNNTNPCLNEDNCMSVYNEVIGSVVEKNITAPESLPDVKFVDSHVPKKRISRFRQMRAAEIHGK